MRRLALAPLLLLAAVTVLSGAAAGAPARTQAAGLPADVLAQPRGARGRAGDWDHVRQVVSWLRHHAPPRRVVYLLGGSATRESITDEASWSRSLRARTGARVEAYVTSSSCQTFVEDAVIVKALPKGRGIALISVGLSRFNMEHVPATVSATSVRTTPPPPWWQHHYDGRSALSLGAKRRRVQSWRTEHLEAFTLRYPDRLAELEALVTTCRARGIRPVLLQMPLDTQAVRHDLDDVLTTYRQGCADLAAKYRIPYIDHLGARALPSADFYDLWHLLPAGRAQWQDRLSRQLVGRGLLGRSPGPAPGS